MQAQPLEMVAFDAPLGAEIKGVDASIVPSPQVVGDLKRAIAEHGCVLLRDQHLDEAQHLAFAEAFGETIVPWLHAVETNTFARAHELPGRAAYSGAHGGIAYFCNGPQYRDEPDDGYLQKWHADLTHLQVPLPYVLLYAVESPAHGYETWYSNQYEAYENLDAATRKRVDDLWITHSYRHVFSNLPRVLHPVVLSHPLSGRRCIYGIPGFADSCPLGVSPEEGVDIMAKLTAHLDAERFVYKHAWRRGDLMIWDNRCALHRRGPQVKGQTRILRRITAGDGDPHEVRRILMGCS